jgi:hypothetical protein
MTIGSEDDTPVTPVIRENRSRLVNDGEKDGFVSGNVLALALVMSACVIAGAGVGWLIVVLTGK